jgi:hypothetical protein
VPPILRRQLVFPYSEGLTFVTALHEQGGFDAVNEALATPPPSTEQILHPEKYFAHEAPIAVQAPDLLASLGNGWYQAYEQTLGELGIQIVVAGGETPEVDIPGLPADWPHADVAAGWGGDRLRMYERTDGQWRIEWTSSWDTTADAVSFRSRMNELTPTFDGVSRVVRDDDRVAVTLASDAALLGGI